MHRSSRGSIYKRFVELAMEDPIIHGDVAIRTRGRMRNWDRQQEFQGACSWTATRLALNSFAEKPKPTLEGWRCRTCENGKQKRRQHFRRCWYELPFIGWWFYLASLQLCFRDWGDEMCGGVSGMMSRRNQSIAYPVFFGQRISRYIRIRSS